MNWLRSNILIVVCLVVILLALVSLYWPTYAQSSAFREEVAGRQQQLSTIRQLQNATVTVPPEEIDAPPRELELVVNEAAIAKLENVYSQLEEEYSGIYDRASEINRFGHEAMLQGLFPSPTTGSKPFEARRAYLAAFDRLYQQMDAGTPPSAMEIETLLARASALSRPGLAGSGNANQSEEERQEALRRQADQLVKRYQDAALSHHVYAAPPELNYPQGVWNTGAFQIGQWAQPTGKPNMFQIWEGQLQLWIQQDMAAAIGLANEVDNPEVSLVQMPIKRVLSMTVKPEYVGAPPPPALGEGTGTEAETSSSATSLQQAMNQRVPGDFTASPTGRATNPIYDVREAVLSIIVDSQQIPKVINAINSVNFMTVIGMDMAEVNEYEHLQEGYYYGDGDVVQLDLTIETIWLRSWTAGDLSQELAEEQGREFYAGLMPDLVRYRLGLPTRDPEGLQETLQNLPQNFTFMGGTGAGQGGAGGYGRGRMQMQMQMRYNQQNRGQ